MTFDRIDPIARLVVEALFNSLWQGVVISLFVELSLRSLRRVNAATRHVVWLGALAAVIAIPAFYVPALSGSGAMRAVLTGRLALPQVQLDPRWAVAVSAAWAAISLILLGRLVWSYGYTVRLARSVMPIELCHQTLSTTHVAASRTASVPAVIGFRRPSILIPHTLLERLSAFEIDQIVLHEQAHIERHDQLWNLAQEVIRSIFFFHPGIWWITRRLRVEREMACDDAVVSATGAPVEYADCLAKVLEISSCAPTALCSGAIGAEDDVFRRVERLVRSPLYFEARVSRGITSAALALLFLAFYAGKSSPAWIHVGTRSQAAAAFASNRSQAEAERVRRQERVAGEKLHAADERMQMADTKLVEAQRMFREAQRRLRAADQKLRVAERRMREADEQMRAANEQMRMADLLAAAGALLPRVRVWCPEGNNRAGSANEI